MLKPIHLRAGLHMFKESFLVRFRGIKKYAGDAKQICESVVKDCYNGKYFQVNGDNYNFFWARDFGISIESLLKLGYKKEVLSTLGYALDVFSKNDKITTAIYSNNKPFNFPDVYSPDSVALLFRSLRVAGANKLIKKYKGFLNREVLKFYNTVLDKETGLVKRKTHFSGMRDYAIRDSSCYDNVMMAVIADEVKRLKLDNPFKKYNFKEIIKNNFWTGSYFLDDLSGSKHITGDANVFPFWLEIFDDKKMVKSAINSTLEVGLDKPLPLKYMSGKAREKMIPIEWFVPNWERDCIWFMIGPLYMQLIDKIDKQKAREYIAGYKETIERYGNYLELYKPNGKPYKSLFYHAGRGMLWAANYLSLLR